MLTILGKASSINVRKVLWLCDEIGLSYAREDWGAGFRPTDDPAFLALNPHGLVPVLRDGDTVLWESNTILRYLATKHRRHDLLPAEPAERAKIEMWMDWQATGFNASWSYAFQGLVRNNPACQDPALLAQSIATWTKQVAILDDRLQQSRHVASDDFTLADIPVALSVNRWFLTPIPQRPDFVNADRYYDMLNGRAAFRRHGRNGLP